MTVLSHVFTMTFHFFYEHYHDTDHFSPPKFGHSLTNKAVMAHRLHSNTKQEIQAKAQLCAGDLEVLLRQLEEA